MPGKKADAPGPAAAAPAAAAAAAEPQQQQGERPLLLDDLVGPLQALPEAERAFGASALLEFTDLMKRVQVGLLTRNPETEEIADQDRILLTYLAAYFKGVLATPHVIHGDMLERALVASGMVLPFAGPSDAGGAARFGVPSNVTPDVICDSASELCRMAAAALLALYVYLNFRRGPNDLPSDDAVLVFTTIAINSCANAANAAKVDAELEALGAPGAIRCAHVRWLMHFVRQLVMNHMGSVCHLLGNKERHAECCVAAQHDHRLMVKALPDVAMGYSLWGRSAMGLQQVGVAGAVLERGLAAAAAAKDDAWEAALCYQLAVSRVLGSGGAAATEAGGGSGGEAKEGGGSGGEEAKKEGEGKEEGAKEQPEATFDASEVLALRARGDAAVESVARWWPAAWEGQRPQGEPDRSVLTDKLIPMAEERAGGQKVEEGAHLPALRGVLYVTRAPTSVPPGAVDAPGAIAEGDEEGEDGDEAADGGAVQV